MAGPRKKPKPTKLTKLPCPWDVDFNRTMIYRRELLRDPEADHGERTHVYVAEMAAVYASKYPTVDEKQLLRVLRKQVADHGYGQPVVL